MSSTKNKSSSHQLSLFGFLMISVSMVISIYAYPTFATSGFAAIFFLIIAGLLWFIPVCLVSAELGTGGNGWSEAGVFSWGAAAFGDRWGFTMIFLQWMEISLGFVSMLYFISSGLAYAFDASIIGEPSIVQLVIILAIFWIITFANFFGTRITKFIATYAFFIGVIFPVAILIFLGMSYIGEGNKIDITFGLDDFFPDFTNSASLVVLVSFILSYMGPEASAVHVNNLKDPGRSYPIAILILVLLTVVIASCSSLTISMVIPKNDISLSGGIFETFKFLFDYYGVSWAIYPFALIISFSTIGEVSSWCNGPVRGIQKAAKDGILPPFLAETNEHMMPTRLLWIQGFIVSFWLIAITLAGMSLGSGNMAFFTAMTITVVVYLAMYILLFLSYIKLKNTVPDDVNPRKFSLSNRFGMITAIVGLCFTLIAFFISFTRPDTVSEAVYGDYLTALIVCFLAVILTPHVIYSLTKKHRAQWLENLKQKEIKDNS
ncbi:MAG: amino acid permease [Rickettsiaceae bacterium]